MLISLDKFLKYWFIFSIIVSVIFAGWLLNFFIYKIFVNNLYINFSYLYYFKYSIYILIILSIYSTIKKKINLRNLTFLILVGFFLHDANFKNLNFKLEYNLKNNILSYKVINFIKTKFVSTNDNNLVFKKLNSELKNNILIRQDLVPGIFIYRQKYKDLIKVIENKGITTLLPFSINKNENSEEYNLIYFQNSSLTKINLKNDFLDQNVIWQNTFNSVFHHWGDTFKNNLYLMGSKTYAFPHRFQKLYKNNFKDCKTGNFLNETIEIIDGKSGKLLNSFFILDIVSDVLPVNNKNFNLICNDPTHSNDVRVIKNQLHADFFPNGKIGDMLISLRHFNSIVLIDNETLELKWHLTGKSNWQHSPRITDSGTILIFDNLGSNPIYGLSRIISVDIKSKKILGIYQANSNIDYFSSESGGRIQVYEESLYINSTNEAKLFKITCDDLDLLRNCDREDIFELQNNSDLFFADLF